MQYFLPVLFTLLSFFLFPESVESQIGTRDSTFGTNGLVDIEYGALNSVTDIQASPDGGLYVFGVFVETDTSTEGLPFVSKLHADGEPDESFGTDGVFIPDIPQSDFIVWDGRILDNGDIVFAGTDAHPFDTIMYARFHDDGSPDTTVSPNGIKQSGQVRVTNSISIAADGSAYWVGAQDTLVFGGVERIGLDGTFDEAFEVNSYVSANIFQILGGQVVRDTCLFVNAINISTEVVWTYLKMGLTGQVDSSYGTNGALTFSSYPQAGDELAQDMNYSEELDQVFSVHTIIPDTFSSNAFINAFTKEGERDDVFNRYRVTPFDTFRPYYSGVALQHDEEDYVLIAGFEQERADIGHLPSVRRLTLDGTPDTTFGDNGMYLDRDLRFERSIGFMPPIQPDIIVSSEGHIYYSYTYETVDAGVNARIIKLQGEMVTSSENPKQKVVSWNMVNPQDDRKWEYTLPESVRGDFSIRVFDRNGALITSKESSDVPFNRKGHIEIPTGITAGMYFVLLQTEEGRSVKRVMYQTKR